MTSLFLAFGGISILLVLLAGLVRVSERGLMKRISESERSSVPYGNRKE